MTRTNSHPTDTLVSARSLGVGYGGEMILRDVHLEIRRGDLWFLLGANGQGKTTFVRTLLGLVPLRTGTLTHHATDAARERIGFVPQRCEVNPALPTTVREFILLGLVGLKIDRREETERLNCVLEQVDLNSRRTDDYASLSGGQRQRALIARALIRRPKLLVLDEPTTGLDPASEDAVFSLLERLNRDEQLTILFVSHDLTMAARHASHIAFFHQGQVLAGPRAEMLTADNIERIYGVGIDRILPPGSLGGHE